MYLLYLDESGNESEPADRHFVLAGAAVFERTTYFLSQSFDELQTQFFPGIEPVEFHASQIKAGRGFWRNIEESTRWKFLSAICDTISNANSPGMVLFAAVVEKSDEIYGERAVEVATEQICSRFDLFLNRRGRDSNDPQRGLIIFSKGRFDKRARLWVRDFRELGTRWGSIKNLSDIPYFATTRETRLLQLADFVAHSVWLLYEKRDARLIRFFLNRFDRENGIYHGLVHLKADPSADCTCPACSSRKAPYAAGDWL